MYKVLILVAIMLMAVFSVTNTQAQTVTVEDMMNNNATRKYLTTDTVAGQLYRDAFNSLDKQTQDKILKIQNIARDALVKPTDYNSDSDFTAEDAANIIAQKFGEYTNGSDATDAEKEQVKKIGKSIGELLMSVQDANITLQSQKMKKDELVGQVKNVGNGTAEFVKISITGYDSAGDVTVTDYTYADASTLERNQKSSFNILLGDDSKDMKSYELGLQWRNPDGTDKYVDNANVTKKKN